MLSGAVIATLWMFPLLNALSSAPVWLHWTARDSLETAAAWAAGALIVALTLAIPAAINRRVLQDIVCSTWLLTSTLFVIAALVKVGGVTAYLATYRQRGAWIVFGVTVAMLALAVWLIVSPGRSGPSRLQRIPQVLWPLVLLLGFHLIRAPGMAIEQTAEITRQHVPGEPAIAAVPTGLGVGPTSVRTVILLFDELSPDYLYGARRFDLSSFPALKRMTEQGEIYSAAHLTGGETRIAIPVLLAATPSAPRGLVSTLNAEGRSVRVWGWYHEYCGSMARDARVCHANSIYNSRTQHDSFSVIDPWWTDFNLLPAQFPFSLLKIPTSVALHRSTLDATRRWLATQLDDPTADVIYVHVNVPHLPLLTAETAKLPVPDPFTMSEEGYRTQFGAVDGVVAQVLDSPTRPTQLIMLSDHNARPLTPIAQHEHVVFIRLRSWAPSGPPRTLAVEVPNLLAGMSLRPDLP